MMKRTIYTLCLISALALAMTSCEKDKTLDEAIIGRWEVKSEQQIYTLDGVKKFVYTFYYEAGEVEYEFTSGGSIIRYYMDDVDGMSTYTISGTTLTIENGDSDIDWDKTSVDGTTLTWSQTGTEVIDEVTYNVEVIYIAAKTN
jgi:hypothetical protein